MNVVVRRVLIVGPPGAGKSTVARELSVRSGLPHTELDHLLFGPNWVRMPLEEFRTRVSEEVSQPTWIIDGNYAGVRDLVWRRAQIVVWLDVPRWVMMYRLLVRTVQRIVRDEDLGAGVRESLGRSIGPNSILLWASRSYRPLQKEYERATDVYSGRVTIVRLRTVSAQQRWLAQARAATQNELPAGADAALLCPDSSP